MINQEVVNRARRFLMSIENVEEGVEENRERKIINIEVQKSHIQTTFRVQRSCMPYNEAKPYAISMETQSRFFGGGAPHSITKWILMEMLIIKTNTRDMVK